MLKEFFSKSACDLPTTGNDPNILNCFDYFAYPVVHLLQLKSCRAAVVIFRFSSLESFEPRSSQLHVTASAAQNSSKGRKLEILFDNFR